MKVGAGDIRRKPGVAQPRMSTGGEVANALVCKTSIRGFDSRPVLQFQKIRAGDCRCPGVYWVGMKPGWFEAQLVS